MLEWLKVHKECPTCRKEMWTEESRFQAKKKLLKKNPDILKMELSLMAVEEKPVRVQRLSLENSSPSEAVRTSHRETEDPEEAQDQTIPLDVEEQRDNPLTLNDTSSTTRDIESVIALDSPATGIHLSNYEERAFP
jgi:hypothetical protein